MKLTAFLVAVTAIVALSTGVTDVNESAAPTTDNRYLQISGFTPLSERAPPKTSKAPERCYSARQGVPFYRSVTHLWQLLRGAERVAGPGPKVRGRSCAYARYAIKEWVARARAAKRSYHRWLSERTLRSQRTWERAVRVAQRPYPGTYEWLMSCSSTEGGHGAFVQNRDGANVWGWVQMHPDTFDRFWVRGWYDPGNGRSYSGAFDSLRERGFRVQARRSASEIDDPLAHALAAAHSYVNGRVGEYHSSGCNPAYR